MACCTNQHPALRRYSLDGLGQANVDWGQIVGAGMELTGEITSAVSAGVQAAQARREAEARTRAITAAVPWIAGAVGLVALALILK